MLFLSGCRSKFSPRHHAVHVWHTAGLGGSHGVSHIYREGLERMFKSNSQLLALETFRKLHWVIQMMSQKKCRMFVPVGFGSVFWWWFCINCRIFHPRPNLRALGGLVGSGWNCYESLRRPLALCLLRLLQTMAAVGAPNQMADEESLSWVVFNPIFWRFGSQCDCLISRHMDSGRLVLMCQSWGNYVCQRWHERYL